MSDLVDDYLRIMRSLNPDPVLLSRIEALEAQRRGDSKPKTFRRFGSRGWKS